MVNSWYPPDRLDWKTRCRPLGAHDAPSLLPGPAVMWYPGDTQMRSVEDNRIGLAPVSHVTL